MSAVAELSTDVEAVRGIGDNQPPPEPNPFDGIKVHLEDLLAEAHNWADGTTVESQAQADEASRLIDDLNKAAKAAEALRLEEKKPLDEQIAAIQARYNEYIAPSTNKVPGKVHKAIVALKATVKPFLDKLEADRLAAAKAAREEAEAAAKAAAEAARAAPVNDLAAQEAANELAFVAEDAARNAKRVENTKTQARGGERAMGLRTVHKAVMTDKKAALLHYLTARPDEIVATLQRLADTDVREGRRQLPGFEIISETVL